MSASASREGVILSPAQRSALVAALSGKLIALCFGAGVDSTAMMVALRNARLRPDVITFADTGGEKAGTLAHLARMNAVLRRWGWPLIDVCRKVPMASTGYSDLYGNCMANETLPSLAFGMKSCSLKWKAAPQDQFFKGAKSGPGARPPHPLWIEAKRRRQRIIELIGYDCGKADLQRSRSRAASAPKWCRSSRHASSVRRAGAGSCGGSRASTQSFSKRRLR